MKAKLGSALLILIVFAGMAQACIWDAKTLAEEKQQHPTLAQAILSPKTENPDVKSLTEDIQKLKANPQTNDPAWWNNLAGSYLRLGQPADAVKILEPLTNRFANDYGIHANLGTAYHLLGRYSDAEREIRRDTEINTNAHFGLEKYHLALLQYLSRDENYRKRHVYVDEFTEFFLRSGGRIEAHDPIPIPEGDTHFYKAAERKQMEADALKLWQQASAPGGSMPPCDVLALLAIDEDKRPGYMAKWDLGSDPKLEDGVIYMATLNPKEPACWTMMGLLALQHHEYHLAKTAFEKSIQLGSHQAPILRMLLEDRIQEQLNHRKPIFYSVMFVSGSAVVVAIYLFCKWREFRRKRRVKPSVGSVLVVFVLGLSMRAQACVNDSRTSRMLWQEKLFQPSLSQAILSPKVEQPDLKSLTEDIQKLQASPKTNDPAWWNDLAGAYIRLGKSDEAVKILEPLTNRFADNYGVHANLGTAYHLLGRYADAEKEIRRDLEINPEAHFGVEKYHLALLQYLSRDKSYQIRHLYVEEFTKPFLHWRRPTIDPSRFSASTYVPSGKEQKKMEAVAEQVLHQSPTLELTFDDTYELLQLASKDTEPGYMAKWDLGKDSKLEDGVMYMAALNPKEPACKVMLGVLAMRHKDLHLAKTAFEQAIQLGSPQAPLLREQIRRLNHVPSSPLPDFGLPDFVVGLIALVIGYYLFCKWREFKRKRRTEPSDS